jgi:hypothetical protein
VAAPAPAASAPAAPSSASEVAMEFGP